MIRRIAIFAIVALCALATVPFYEYYNIRYNRPLEIQRELLGQVVARRAQLVDFDWHMMGYGDALFRWSYSVEHPEELRRSCTSIDRGACILGGRADNNTSLSVYLVGNTVSIEESWY